MGEGQDDDLLTRLVGGELYSVQFVRDNMQLHFESLGEAPYLTCYVMPEIRGLQSERAQGITESSPGYADALRALIGEEVRAATAASGTGLTLQLRTSTIIVNPAPTHLVGPEIAMLSGFSDRAWMVWRPGEDDFAHLA
ncbi:hypothetical protein GCM10010403_40800 [Glycomyces rutgersensis]|uniref:Uncharacterized protein n=2 Tax=Glycomyces TaxID=58113 RepID=A0ABU2AJW4_9ACTN|nr:hypothetical protein [Glycomyces lechevalierae]